MQTGMHIFAGKKRSGKTMTGTKYLWADLANTKRIAVSNIAVVWPGAQTYLENKYGFAENLHDRLEIIQDTQKLRWFFLYRGRGWWLPKVTPEAWGRGQRLDLRYAYRWTPTLTDIGKRPDPCDLSKVERDEEMGKDRLEQMAFERLPKVFYFLDELHLIYPAKQAFPEEPILRFYLAQQSKLGDCVLATLQNPDWLDKSFRDIADDYMFFTNWGRKQKGLFRLPKVGTWSKFPKIPGHNEQPEVTGTFRIDIKGLGQTYDTSAGVGIEGGLDADTQDKTPGIHYAWVFVFIIAFCGLLWFGLKGMRYGFGKVVGKGMPKPEATTHTNAPAPVYTPQQNKPAIRPANPAAREQGPKRTLTGIMIFNGTATAFMNDGTSLSATSDKWLSMIYENKHPVGVKTTEGIYRIGTGPEKN